LLPTGRSELRPIKRRQGAALQIEVRTYKIKPGRRDAMKTAFESYEVVLTETTPGGAVDSMK
jgi:hypothetical protein